MQSTAERQPPAASAPTTAVRANPEPHEVWQSLPGGVERTIRVHRDEIGLVDGRPFVLDAPDVTGTYMAVRIEGACELIHTVLKAQRWCRPNGTAHIKTTAPLSVRVR